MFTYTFADGEQLLLWMGDRWNSNGPGSVAAASYVSRSRSVLLCFAAQPATWLVLRCRRALPHAVLCRECSSCAAEHRRQVRCCLASALRLQVWLPLLPRLGGPGFELVFARNWTLR